MESPHIIEVHASTGGQTGLELLSILESVMPVKFAWVADGGRSVSGKLLFGKTLASANANSYSQVSTLTLPHRDSESAVRELIPLKVQFSDDRNVPFPFRGRSLSVRVAKKPDILTLDEGEVVLAKTEMGIAWCASEKGDVKHFRTSLELPTVPVDGGLQDVLNGDRFLEILPLLHFLRSASEDDRYEAPALRAQFMFDDPNLHWPSYGYVDYQELATRAKRGNYHVSFATVPLDAWATNRRAAEIFRNNPRHLSLCVHGNNHTKRELAQNVTPVERARLVEQAIQRITQLEQEAGVPVSRVMVPPHGACAHEMLEELPRRGFESACVSAGSLRAHNKARTWVKQLGYLPSELIGECPVLPRWALANSNENTVLLAAFLRQPIVLRGHHRDLKDGIELLDGFARVVNSLGHVTWSNMTDLSRGNYYWKNEGGILKLKPLGSKISVAVSELTTGVLVESSRHQNWIVWRVTDADKLDVNIHSGECFRFQIRKKQTVTLEVVSPSVSPILNHSEALPVAAFVRRILTEGRDRLVATLGM